MTEQICPPCAQKYLDNLDKKWLDSDGEDLATEGLILAQCFKMNIDCDEHMTELKTKLRNQQQTPKEQHEKDYPENARARKFDGGF